MIPNKTFDAALVSNEFFANPYPIYHQMRSQAPVYWSDAWRAWVLTRYDDVMLVLRRSDVFSSAGRVRYLLDTMPSQARHQVAALERHYEIGIAHTDPPDHTRLRRLLTHVFTPQMVARRRQRIREIVQAHLDTLAHQSEFDIIDTLAYPIPATVIAGMIGAPDSDIGFFRDWAVAINRLFEKGGHMTEASAQAAQASLQQMRDYIADLVAIKRRDPADDILSRLVSAQADHEQLTMDELVSTVVTFFVAGHETTTNLIGNGMLALLQHPAQMQRFVKNPALIENAVTEMLRYDPSVPRAWRIAKTQVEIGGQQIEPGDLVFPMIAAANRDPQHFPQPDHFDIERDPNKHLAFGYGIHYCLGAPLAQLEGAEVIGAIVHRFPQMALATDTLSWRHDVAIRSLEALPVRVLSRRDAS